MITRRSPGPSVVIATGAYGCRGRLRSFIGGRRLPRENRQPPSPTGTGNLRPTSVVEMIPALTARKVHFPESHGLWRIYRVLFVLPAKMRHHSREFLTHFRVQTWNSLPLTTPAPPRSRTLCGRSGTPVSACSRTTLCDRKKCRKSTTTGDSFSARTARTTSPCRTMAQAVLLPVAVRDRQGQHHQGHQGVLPLLPR